MAIAVGIDLGTSTSEVAFVDPATSRVTVVPFPGAQPFVPSAVRFDEAGGQIVVGWDAYSMRVSRHREVVLRIKKSMGEPEFVPRPFQGREYGAPEIAGEILKYLRAESQRFSGSEVRQAVITVPARFETLAREHTEKAAEIAGLETLMLLPEPVAALVGYTGARPDRPYVAMVYDFGGGTFDCSVVHAQENRYRVLSKAGARHLGGSDIDERIARKLIEPKVTEAGFDLGVEDDWALRIRQRILDAAENAKISLADEERRSTWVNLPNLEAPGRAKTTVRVEIRQEEVQELIAPFLRQANEQMEKALNDAGLSREELDLVILVGGTTRLPAIRHAVRAFMGESAYGEGERNPARRKVLADDRPELLVARGAAIVAASHGQKGRGIELVDILLHTVGVREPGTDRFQPILAKGTDISAAQRDLIIGWPRGDTVALDLYEGEGQRCSEEGVKYVGTIKAGPARLAPRTPVILSVRYRTDVALPQVSARLKTSGEPLPTAMVFEQGRVSATGSPELQAAKEWDLAFCVDTTGSMRHGPALASFRLHCQEFVRWLKQSDDGIDVRLAAVTFGDRASGEEERVYSFTPDPELFVARLSDPACYNDGGDEPESALDALVVAERLPFRAGDAVQRRIILITDAPPQPLQSGSLDRLIASLTAKSIRLVAITPHCPEFDAVIGGTRGLLYDLRRQDIEEALRQFFVDLTRSLPPRPGGA